MVSSFVTYDNEDREEDNEKEEDESGRTLESQPVSTVTTECNRCEEESST